ncbi:MULTISPECIES: hypothetical protein [Ignavibacterium]|jgi:hypothetical protein|uniref:hypothetical protein n=1 Tax=Ignavibacterium TaxID=795750 RepID=UPI0025BE0819|nr:MULTISPECIES: hypothetical protein [Ignavibacterium]MBI5661957.1 hypothetical protein [Ignavibacterium album]
MRKLVKILMLILISLINYSCNLDEPAGNDYYYTWASDYLQSSSRDSRIPDTIKTLYKLDAAILAFRTMLTDTFARDNIVEINEDVIEEMYRGLICIYNLKNYRPLNIITEHYKIHARENPSLTRLILVVDTTKEWTQAWRNGQRLTGNQEIDQLILTYDLQLGKRWFFSNYHTLVSPRPLNLLALKNLFKKIDGVLDATPDGLIGDGNDIIFNYARSNRVYTFILGWGDCLAGCMNSHYWDVAVTPDEKVKFIKEYGDPLP